MVYTKNDIKSVNDTLFSSEPNDVIHLLSAFVKRCHFVQF